MAFLQKAVVTLSLFLWLGFHTIFFSFFREKSKVGRKEGGLVLAESTFFNFSLDLPSIIAKRPQG